MAAQGVEGPHCRSCSSRVVAASSAAGISKCALPSYLVSWSKKPARSTLISSGGPISTRPSGCCRTATSTARPGTACSMGDAAHFPQDRGHGAGDAGKIAEASRQLGHASKEVTLSYYIAKPRLAPDVTDVLDTLGPRRG